MGFEHINFTCLFISRCLLCFVGVFFITSGKPAAKSGKPKDQNTNATEQKMFADVFPSEYEGQDLAEKHSQGK